MNNNRIWLSLAHMGGHEQSFIQSAFDANWVTPLGPNVDAFEHDLETFLDNRGMAGQARPNNLKSHVAALTAGTAALHLGLILLDVHAGDEVLCQSFTFSASTNPIRYQNATPVFCGQRKGYLEYVARIFGKRDSRSY
jgi:dTDP-4-amino-4,6-dideoxygalactose transaminase